MQNVIVVTVNRFQISKANSCERPFYETFTVFYWGIEMMTVVIITLLVVGVFYFAWDEISAARAAKKELNEAWKGSRISTIGTNGRDD